MANMVIGRKENVFAVRGDGHWFVEKLELNDSGEWVFSAYGEEFTPYKGEKKVEVISREKAKKWCYSALPVNVYSQLFCGGAQLF